MKIEMVLAVLLETRTEGVSEETKAMGSPRQEFETVEKLAENNQRKNSVENVAVL